MQDMPVGSCGVIRRYIGTWGSMSELIGLSVMKAAHGSVFSTDGRKWEPTNGARLRLLVELIAADASGCHD
jgi:hypothetical protein